jgi:cysteine desulfurase
MMHTGTIYLDWAATSPPDPEILDEIRKTALDCYGNPSSPHPEGQKALSRLQTERERLAGCLGCGKEEIIFTSGGTESNNLVLHSVLFSRFSSRQTPQIVLSGIEHPSLYAPARRWAGLGVPVKHVPANPDGRVETSRLMEAVDRDTRLVTVLLVSNETGAVQPVAEMAEEVKAYASRTGRRIHFHTDAVQALGKIPLDLPALGVDSASLSAHKLRGPRGAGALYLSKTAALDPVYRGGDQERGIRPGTENLPAIAGFRRAAEKAISDLESEGEKATGRMKSLAEELLRIPGAVIIPGSRLHSPSSYSPYILSLAFPPIPGEVLVRVLGEKGICISTGSACSSRKKDRDRVLRNMGVPGAVSHCAVRISTGSITTDQELQRLRDVLRLQVPPLLKIAEK